jgi:hypothetical protein
MGRFTKECDVGNMHSIVSSLIFTPSWFRGGVGLQMRRARHGEYCTGGVAGRAACLQSSQLSNVLKIA